MRGFVTQPLASPFPDPGFPNHFPVRLFIQELGLGIDDDQVEGPAVLVPSSLSLFDGRLSLFDGLGFLGLGAVGLAQDGGDAVRSCPREDGDDELLCGRFQGPHAALFDAGHAGVEGRHLSICGSDWQ